MPVAQAPAAPPRDMRADTVDTAITSLSLNIPEKLWKDNVGIFYPDHPDNINKTGIMYNGKLTIYTDVYAFIDAIQSLCIILGLKEANNTALLRVLPKCFQGAAKE